MSKWFKEKRYGWGWYPVTWQGWFVVAGYVALMVWIFRNIDKDSHSVSDTLIPFFPYFVIATGALIYICFKKGGWPHWRWGK
ncbi:MAG: hypothetical protein KW806_03375 [Candidatus Yanofskybacteria bacterium]|nr:hypothetical protein [Candidatus Yanofskybacteria bacterium]